jgi:hypothetical protein
MTGLGSRFVSWFKSWRAKNREYAIQRALYKQGGGATPPSVQMDSLRTGPGAATHGPDLSKLSEDE